ncbi:MAG: hypothetical protein ACLQLC_00945 [Candidatus Sulfotelmatobacter sp.]
MKNRLALGSFALLVFAFAIVAAAAPLHSTPANSPVQVAYAHVNGDGTLDAEHSLNVLEIGGGDGLYCFKLTFIPHNATATLADDPTAPSQGVGFIKAALPPTPLFTCSNIESPDATVETGNVISGNSGISGGGYAFYAYWIK